MNVSAAETAKLMSALRQASKESTDRKAIPWGYLVFAIPMAYVLYDPFQQRAPWTEWVITCLVLVAEMSLFLTGILFKDDKPFVRKLCLAHFIVAVGFLAYRPSGGIFFPLAASFVPVAFAGSTVLAIALMAVITLVFGLEWWWLYAGTPGNGPIFPLFVVVQIVSAGGGMVFANRQNQAIKRGHEAAERERIARDLHDVLGHTLSSIALKSELARRLFDADPSRALAEISEVEQISRTALDDVREAIHGYCISDIFAELERAQSLLQAADVEVTKHLDVDEMEPAHERVLGLILREAVTNVVRHAHASSCNVSLTNRDNAYRLEVRDDGRGGDHVPGVGMKSIRARIEAIGGTADWDGASGTKLVVLLPNVASSVQA